MSIQIRLNIWKRHYLSTKKGSVMSEIKDSNLVLIYNEILTLRGVVDGLQRKMAKMEKDMNELSTVHKHKKRGASISSGQREILGFLKKGGKTQAEIVAGLNIPQPSISYSLNKLEKELNIDDSMPTMKSGARFEYALKKNLPQEILDLISKL